MNARYLMLIGLLLTNPAWAENWQKTMPYDSSEIDINSIETTRTKNGILVSFTARFFPDKNTMEVGKFSVNCDTAQFVVISGMRIDSEGNTSYQEKGKLLTMEEGSILDNHSQLACKIGRELQFTKEHTKKDPPKRQLGMDFE